jgi:hypothetical protein
LTLSDVSFVSEGLGRTPFLHVRGELTQRLVEVVHLRENAPYNHDDEDICGRMRELVVARKGHLERQTERLDEHDGHGAGGRANGEVDERVLATILGRDLVNHEDGENGDEEAVEEEACECPSVLSVALSFQLRTWLNRQIQDLIDRRDLLVRRRMQYDDDRSDETYCASNLSQHAELFVQEVGAQHCADEHGESSERGD